LAVNADAEKPQAGAIDRRSHERAGQSRFARFAVYCSTFVVWVLLIFFATGGLHGSSWLAAWQQWDARWYEQIWREGYPKADPRTLVFPPGYPLFVGAISKLFSTSFFGTAVILNLAFFLGTAILIAEWLSQKFGIPACLLFVFMLSAPAAYFSFTAYSDLIFMFLLWISVWLALGGPRGHEALIGEIALLFVIPWIRLTGYALASWLLARRTAALAVLASLGVWLAFNRLVAGSSLYFLHAQQLFAMPRGNFLSGLADSLFQLVYSFTKRGITIWLEFGFLPLFYLIALISAGIWLVKRREGLLAITLLSILAISYNQSVWRSVVRYDLPLTPVLCLPLLMAGKSRSRAIGYCSHAIFWALTVSQFALQIYFARLFHSGGWAF
jgi:hypothetical protein